MADLKNKAELKEFLGPIPGDPHLLEGRAFTAMFPTSSPHRALRERSALLWDPSNGPNDVEAYRYPLLQYGLIPFFRIHPEWEPIGDWQNDWTKTRRIHEVHLPDRYNSGSSWARVRQTGGNMNPLESVTIGWMWMAAREIWAEVWVNFMRLLLEPQPSTSLLPAPLTPTALVLLDFLQTEMPLDEASLDFLWIYIELWRERKQNQDEAWLQYLDRVQ